MWTQFVLLMLMAMELDITVVALSQLSRAPEARRDHRPMLSASGIPEALNSMPI